jgi:hypothetical protein
MLSKITTKEAIRMVGHLLEMGSTTHNYATDESGSQVGVFDPEACRFCLSGALRLVDKMVLGNHPHNYPTNGGIYAETQSIIGCGNAALCQVWDSSTDEQRKQIIEKLKNV